MRGDLGPADSSLTTVIEAKHTDTEARRLIRHVRTAGGAPVDVIVMAVPAGKGIPFIRGLAGQMHRNGQLVDSIGVDESKQAPCTKDDPCEQPCMGEVRGCPFVARA